MRYKIAKFIANRYGSKRGLLRHLRCLVIYYFGGYRGLVSIDWARVDRFVFVCKGNICRSPYAEAVAVRHRVHATSFGLSTSEGHGAHPNAVRNASVSGIDLKDHRSKSAENFVILDTDVLIAMEPSQVRALKRRAGNAQVTLLGLWAKPPRPLIYDPYSSNDAYFQMCFSLVDDAVTTLVTTARKATGVHKN